MQTNNTTVAEIIDIANRIDSDVMQISASFRWPDVTAGLAGIMRTTRELRNKLSGPAIVEAEARTPAAEIAAGYHQAIESQLEGIAYLLAQMEGDELLAPRTISLCEMLINMAAVTQHKYVRAAMAANAEWQAVVAEAEAEFVGQSPRPFDIDGELHSPMPSPSGRGGALEDNDEREAA
jgi:hypothetical protein